MVRPRSCELRRRSDEIGGGRIEHFAAGCGIGDNCFDRGLTDLLQQELAVANPEGVVLDQHVLKFDRSSAALVFYLGAKPLNVRDRKRKFLAGGIRAFPGAGIKGGIDRDILHLRRRRQWRRLVAVAENTEDVRHWMIPEGSVHPAAHARPLNPAAMLRLMSIRGFICSRCGLICNAAVWDSTKTLILAMFCRTSNG